LNSSTSFDPSFWLDYQTGNHYFVGVTFREEAIDSLSVLENTPITSATTKASLLLKDVAEIQPGNAAVEVAHRTLTRVVNLYANVSGRDVGSVAADVQDKLSSWGKRVGGGTTNLPSWAVPNADKPGEFLAGYTVRMRGEVASMQESFRSLGSGLVLAVVLIYLLMVAQFRSFLDPFIIMTAVPLGIVGTLVLLYLTGTTVNVQSFMGVIFTVGRNLSSLVHRWRSGGCPPGNPFADRVRWEDTCQRPRRRRRRRPTGARRDHSSQAGRLEALLRFDPGRVAALRADGHYRQDRRLRAEGSRRLQ
jgi:hypothetical protein